MKTFIVPIKKVVVKEIEVEAETATEATLKAAERNDVDQAGAAREKLWIVRLYDGMDNQWCDVSKPCIKEEAQEIWNKETANGTKNTKYSDIDYYAIYPADTKMIYSGGFGEI